MITDTLQAAFEMAKVFEKDPEQDVVFLGRGEHTVSTTLFELVEETNRLRKAVTNLIDRAEKAERQINDAKHVLNGGSFITVER